MKKATAVAIDDDDECGQNDEDGLGPVVWEFLDMIPLEEFLTLYMQYLNLDEEVRNVFLFIQSDEFAVIVNTMYEMEEFITVRQSSNGRSF